MIIQENKRQVEKPASWKNSHRSQTIKTFWATSIVVVVVLMNSAFTQAAVTTIGPVHLDSVSIINVASYGHDAGNLEIKVTNGITNLNGLNCDSNYVTTNNSGAGFKDMVAILLAALASDSPVLLGITDDPAQTAFPGRCSLLYSSIQRN